MVKDLGSDGLMIAALDYCCRRYVVKMVAVLWSSGCALKNKYSATALDIAFSSLDMSQPPQENIYAARVGYETSSVDQNLAAEITDHNGFVLERRPASANVTEQRPDVHDFPGVQVTSVIL